MAFEVELADRVRAALSTRSGVTEKRMFGGLAFLVDGAMAVAVSGQGGLMVRCDPARTEELRAAPGAGPMVMRGREITGWVLLSESGVDDEADLRRWVDTGCAAAAAAPGRRSA